MPEAMPSWYLRGSQRYDVCECDVIGVLQDVIFVLPRDRRTRQKDRGCSTRTPPADTDFDTVIVITYI